MSLDVIVVRRCIGCGAIDTPQPCLGTCADRRVDLVGADDHAAVEADLARAQRTLATLRALASQLTDRPLDHDGWDALRSRARAALRELRDPPGPGATITAWACDSCGRIEAPQPCIGVCIRPETPMVGAADHVEAVRRAGEVRRELEPLVRLARLVAWTTPHADAWEPTARAFEALALRVL